MPNIVNLGTTERRESPLSGLSEGLKTGISAAIDIQTLKQRERERQTQEKALEGQLASELASQELRKKAQNIELTQKTHDMFSEWWTSMDPQQQAIAKTSDQYKELQKFFKYQEKELGVPFMGDDGTIITTSTSKIAQRKLDEAQAQAKLNISQGKTTKEDIALLELSGEDKEMFGDAMQAAKKQLTASEARDPNRFIGAVKNFFGRFRKQPMQMSDALSQPAITQPQQPVLNPATNALQDPIGILGR